MTCPLPEIFFGGARGGGKTDGVLGKWANKEKRYGSHFNARMFRKTTTSSDDAIERAKEIYLPLGASFNATKLVFTMPRGGRVAFGYLDGVQDADAQQGKNLTDAWIEEAGQHASPAAIDKLQGALRSAHGVPVQMILTANPGGAGQGWIRDRYQLVPFPQHPKIVDRLLPNGAVHRMAVIPSRLTDNAILLAGDPNYQNRLQLVGSPHLVKAWLEGDWGAVEGAFFEEWDEGAHVIDLPPIPAEWHRFRSMDWGSAKPFSVGWWAIVPDPVQARTARGIITLPRGAMVRYREWYGMRPHQPNVGLKLTAEQVGDGIVEREKGEKIAYGVLDPAAFSEDGGPSIAERMARRKAHFIAADNARVGRNGAMGGWDQMRSRLRGEDDGPRLYVGRRECPDWIRTVPVLQHDQSRPEDLDTDAEDHIADETRYACMSRPYEPKAPKASASPNPGYKPPAPKRQSWRAV
ncbi:phage terminase large subunit [Methylobacterium sp. Gmos1]